MVRCGGGFGVEATGGTLDLLCADEIGEGALDLEWRGVGEVVIDASDGEWSVGVGEEAEDGFGEEATVEGAGVVFEEVLGVE